MYAPQIKSARRVREHALGPDHTAVLMTDIQGEPTSRIRYAHLLVVYRRGLSDPIAFIAAEEAKMDDEDLEDMGFDADDFAPEPDHGSHFLCAFVEDGHKNFGASDDWADLDKFESAALGLTTRLGLAPAAQ